MRHLALILFIYSLTCISYQTAFARANSFVAKKVRTGDNLISILRAHGFSEFERAQILETNKDFQRLILTLDVDYFVRQGSRGAEIKFYDQQKDIGFLVLRKKERATVEEFQPTFRIQLARIQGVIHGSLMSSIQNKIKSNWVASRFMDAYLLEYNLDRALGAGARFSLLVEKKYDGTQFIKYGEVLQTALSINGQNVQKRFVKFSSGGVFVAQRDLINEKPFYAPVDYLRIASTYQPNRRHPITRKVQPHLGIDFELPEGEPIYAVRRGTVVRHGRSYAAGNYVVILHPNGVETAYNHMRRLDAKIVIGRKIQAGEKIGEVGCTGYCTRPHLHFAVKIKGRMVDPARYLKSYPILYEQSLISQVAEN